MRSTIYGLGLLLIANAAFGDSKSDLAKLQGTWVVDKDGTKVNLTFDKNKFTLAFPDKSFKGTFKIDASKTPKQMDMMIKEGEKYVGKTSNVIYDLTDDTFKWLAKEPGTDGRATAFPAKQGEQKGYFYLIFKRLK
jgi:uncharacterized protein (TIGR03067 family)